MTETNKQQYQTMQQLTDIECVARIIDGDTDVFGVLVERYSQRVYALVSGVVGAGAEAEDIAQEVFIKAWTNLTKFSHKSTFATWLYRIAYNAALSSKRIRRQLFAEVSDRVLATVSEEVEQQVFTDADVDALEDALTQLPPRSRAIVELHYRHNLPLSEVAEVVGSSEGNVKVIIHRARRQLALLINNSRNDGE